MEFYRLCCHNPVEFLFVFGLAHIACHTAGGLKGKYTHGVAFLANAISTLALAGIASVFGQRQSPPDTAARNSRASDGPAATGLGPGTVNFKLLADSSGAAAEPYEVLLRALIHIPRDFDQLNESTVCMLCNNPAVKLDPCMARMCQAACLANSSGRQRQSTSYRMGRAHPGATLRSRCQTRSCCRATWTRRAQRCRMASPRNCSG
jgi:hypothetical protein